MDKPIESAHLSLKQMFAIFFRLGCIAFGGPTAHIAIFQREFVENRRWLSDQQYAQIVALSQWLPGPASSQVGMALGWIKGGWLGMLTCWCAFTLPAAVFMWALAAGLVEQLPAGTIQGLLIAAAAIVAIAIESMAKQLCPNRKTQGLALISLAFALLMPSTMASAILVIALGATTGFWLLDKDTQQNAKPPQSSTTQSSSTRAGYAWLAAWALLLAASFFASNLLGAQAWILDLYKTGALVFGGGHAVLPLLQESTLQWGMSADTFLTGYASVQAAPGPLFTLSAYLGALQANSTVVGAIFGIVMMFLPSLLLMPVALSHWQRLQGITWLGPILAGINAAVVGLLAATWLGPVRGHAMLNLWHVAAFILAWHLMRNQSVALIKVVAGYAALGSLIGLMA